MKTKREGILWSRHSIPFLHLRSLIGFEVEKLRFSANLLYSLFYRRFLPPTYVNTPLGRRTAISPQNLRRPHARTSCAACHGIGSRKHLLVETKREGILWSRHSIPFLRLRSLIGFEVEKLRFSANLLYSLFYRRFLPPTYVNTPLGRRTAISPQNLRRPHARTSCAACHGIGSRKHLLVETKREKTEGSLLPFFVISSFSPHHSCGSPPGGPCR